MSMQTKVLGALVALAAAPRVIEAQEHVREHMLTNHARNTGASGLWILANISYAGMRAQDSTSSGWRMLAFIGGFPGTLLTFLCVKEGSERAYGVEIPTAHSSLPPFDDSLDGD